MSISAHDKKRHRHTEAQEWYFRLVNDYHQFEKERSIDAINYYNSIIAELQRLYEQTPTSDRFMRARIQSGMSKRFGKNSG
jgi:hypothetical protein